MEKSRIDFALRGIGSLLKDRQLGVPIYQRSYSWESDQITDYWNDLKSSFAKTDPEYFLGTVVLTREGLTARDAIIDGQQRLATTSILLAAIRDEYLDRSDSRYQIIQSDFLAARDLGSGNESPHLTLNSDDDSYFRQLVMSVDALEPASHKPSHKHIKRAYELLRSFVRVTADDAGTEWDTKLATWVSFLREHVRVIVVDVPTESDAFLIFETLNDRGADLTIADLLKNYLFGKAGARLDVVRDGWMQTLGALEMTTEAATFTMFLRHYWSSKHGLTRERELYKSIKEQITNETTAVSLIGELQVAGRYYAAIQSSDHEVWTQLGTTTQNNVETLLRLDLEQYRPLLLAALQHFSERELKLLLRKLVSWSVRGLIVGGLGGGAPEKAFCTAAVKVRSGEIKSTDEVRVEIGHVIATDSEFESAFATTRVTRGYLARYYLAALEGVATGKKEPELVANEDEELVNLEHILPKNAKSTDWPQFTADETKSYVYRLGNMALLSRGRNGKIGNKAWDIKKPVLNSSQLNLTRAAGAEDSWTVQAITDRQADLAKLALRAWPR